MKTNSRPVNLDLATMRFPVMAIASILHRLSGIALFVATPIALYFLEQSLVSVQSFAWVKQCFANVWVKVIFWAMLVAVSYHLIAGIRHMIMDLGIGESLEAGKKSALTVIIVAAIAALLLGAWIW